MKRRGGKSLKTKTRRVQQIFLDSLEALAQSPDQLVAAVSFGLERAIDQLVRQACEEEDIDPDDFSAELEKDPALRTGIQERVAQLFNEETIEQAKAGALRRDLERHLQILRYVLGGKDPADWVWQSMDDQEVRKVRTIRAQGGEQDPELYSLVQKAMGKLEKGHGFGACESCQKEIRTDRLQLMPYAPRCTACQRALEEPGSSTSVPRVPFFMFFEGGKPVPPEQRQVS